MIASNIKNRVDILSVFLVFLTLTYLCFVNYNLGFLTLDEFNHTITGFGATVGEVYRHGRTSHLIGAALNQVFGFSVPDFWGLTPRFLGMMSLYLALILILRDVGRLKKYAVHVASFCILAHQVDWQHNGMVAFFGNYNWYLAFFLLYLHIDLHMPKKAYLRVAAAVMLFLSFASELFVGLVVVIGLAKWVLGDRKQSILKSTWFLPLALYMVGLIAHRFFAENSDSSRMASYLYGSIGDYSLFDIFRGAWLYTVYSIPAFVLPTNPTTLLPLVGALVTLTFLVSPFVVAFRKGIASDEGSDREKASIIILTFSCIAVASQHLTAIQPTKLKWILESASTRYAFSYYTWIAIVVLMAFWASTLNKWAQFRFAGFFTTLVLCLFVIRSFRDNSRFVGELRFSKDKWISLQQIAKSGAEAISISDKFLEHPYILPISDEWMKRYVGSVYGKGVEICHSLENDLCGKRED